MLRDTALDLGDPGYDIAYGYGLVQVGNIIEETISRISDPRPTGEPTVTPTPTGQPIITPTPVEEPTVTPTPLPYSPLSVEITFESSDGQRLEQISDWAENDEVRAVVALSGISEEWREINLFLTVYNQNEQLEFLYIWPLNPISDSLEFSETISLPATMEAAFAKVILLDGESRPLRAPVFLI